MNKPRKSTNVSNTPSVVASTKATVHHPRQTTNQTRSYVPEASAKLKDSYNFQSPPRCEFSKEFKEKYSQAVDYVNICHRFMNKLLREKYRDSGDTDKEIHDFKIPEVANFVPVVDTLLQNQDQKSCVVAKEVCSAKQKPNRLTHAKSTVNTATTNNTTTNRGVDTSVLSASPSNNRGKFKSNKCIDDLLDAGDNISVKKSLSQLIADRDINLTNPAVSQSVCNLGGARNCEVAMSKTLLTNKAKQNNMKSLDVCGVGSGLVNNAVKVTKDKGSDRERKQGVGGSSGVAKSRSSSPTATDTASSLPPPPKLKEPRENVTSQKDSIQDYDSHLLEIIQGQIKKFLSSTSEENNAYVLNKPQDINIDDFKLPESAALDIQDYRVDNEQGDESDNFQDSSRRAVGQSKSYYAFNENPDQQQKLQNHDCNCRPSTTIDNSEYSSISKSPPESSGTHHFTQKVSKLALDEDRKNVVVNKVESMFNQIKQKSQKQEVNTRLVKKIVSHGAVSNYQRCSNEETDNSTISSDDEVSAQGVGSNHKGNNSSMSALPRESTSVLACNRICSANVIKESQHLSQDKLCHPLKLNCRDLPSLNQKMLSTIGLFTESGDIRPEILEFLEEEKQFKENDVRNKTFRNSRRTEPVEDRDHPDEIQEVGSNCSLSCASSDIKSDSEVDKGH